MKSWPENVPRELEFPEKPLHEFLRDQARLNPEKPAIIFYGTEITFRELDRRTDQLAAALGSLGLKKGDRAALFMENSPQFVIGYFAILKAGGVVAAANPMFKEDELGYEVGDAGAKILICQDILYPKAEPIREKSGIVHVITTSYGDYLPASPSIPVHPSMQGARRRFSNTLDLLDLLDSQNSPPPRPDFQIREDLALLQYTSGTTGQPKGAMISHYSLLYNTASSAAWRQIHGRDIVLSTLPFFHVTGMIHSMTVPVYAGIPNVMISRFDAGTVLEAVHRYRCTLWTAITTMNVALVNFPGVERYDLTSLRHTSSGGAPVPPEVLEKWRRRVGTELSEGYGLSETISQTHMNPGKKPRYGSIGIPEFGLDCRIVDLESDEDVPEGKEGELLVKGPTVMKGYWNRPEDTEEVLRDGWLRTGDIARIDGDGFFYIVGRKKDLIKASGFSVYPAEVENFLYRHPAVRETAVIGVPDPYRGENVKALIVLKPEYTGRVTEKEIIEWCRGKMAAYKYPRLVEFVPDLPKTGSGKIQKKVLREREKKPA